MFYIFKTQKGEWIVAYEDHYITTTRSITARCKSPLMAARVCSWLNGGQEPSMGYEEFEWIGE